LKWFQPSAHEVQWYMHANSVFIATLLVAYYLNSPAKKFAQGRLKKWPEVNIPVTFFVLACCTSVLVVSAIFRRVPFVAPATFMLSMSAAPAAVVFSFNLWYRNRANVGWLLLFIAVFLGACLYSMVASAGRRLLLSVFLAPVLYMYWVQLRHWGRMKILVTLGLAAVLIFGVSVIYSKFRYYSAGTHQGRSAKGIVGQLNEIRAKGDWMSVFMRGPLQYVGQNTGGFALLTHRFVAQGVLTPVPLNTLRFLVTYPIPREVWHEKPQVLGVKVTHDAAHIPDTNWGVGISGQGIYEGGLPALMLYAVLLTFGIRFMDEPLRLQPGNPFLIYMHASAWPHLVAIPRGDMGVMVMQTGLCVLFAALLGIACRSIFGTQRTPLPARDDSQRAAYPVRRVLPARR
jgi:hypothetical protein